MSWTTLLTAIVAQGVALSLAMACAWTVQRRTGNSGWIDFTWTLGTGAVGALSAMAVLPGTQLSARQCLIAALAAVWSVRLATHIALRTVGSGDDPRYAALTREWGTDAPCRMFLFAQAQALASLPLVATIFIAAHRPGEALGAQDLLGGALLALAIGGEALADQQLRAFRADANNRDGVCDVGLWRWSRHPNYFFQWLGWLAYPVIAIDPSGSYAWSWLTIAAPICMYWLLVHVSGIPPLEAHMLRSRGQSFRDYQRRTSAFFPLPPGPAT